MRSVLASSQAHPGQWLAFMTAEELLCSYGSRLLARASLAAGKRRCEHSSQQQGGAKLVRHCSSACL